MCTAVEYRPYTGWSMEKCCQFSMRGVREAMHGDAARTAALLLMIACSTDAPAAIRCPG